MKIAVIILSTNLAHTIGTQNQKLVNTQNHQQPATNKSRAELLDLLTTLNNNTEFKNLTII
jgi:hypothetical protein